MLIFRLKYELECGSDTECVFVKQKAVEFRPYGFLLEMRKTNKETKE